MIEVEIRGRLNKEEYERLKKFLGEKGKFIKHTNREMFLIYDHPGYSHDPMAREVDIRLRNTNGDCEIMMKKKASANNEAREEISLKLRDGDLENAKRIMKALGYPRALKMQRSTDVYEHEGTEWSLVRPPKDYFYYEAEQGAEEEADVSRIHNELVKKAKALDLEVLGPKEMKEFIAFLDKEVNEEVAF
ncbi:MAG: CYTH domain-containing protein [Minisyncoccia bacterium]|jgi:predicted adenylyl cyclase CyaB